MQSVLLHRRYLALAMILIACIGISLVASGCGENQFGLYSFLSSGLHSDHSPDQDYAKNSDVGQEKGAQDSPKKLPKAEDLIKDWPKPDVAIFVSGRLHGYIEPCGCTGLENQKGGLLRRHTVQKLFLKRGWDLVSIDAGNQIRRFGQQPIIKLTKAYEALCSIFKYDVIGLGPDDLKTPTIEFAQTLLNSQTGKNPFTSANVMIFGDDSIANPYRVINKNGVKVGVTVVMGDKHSKKLKDKEDLTIVNVATGLQKVVPKLLAENCDVKVIVAQMSMKKCHELARSFPHFDLIISTGSAGDPIMVPEQEKVGAHITNIIQVGVKGMHAGIVGYYSKNPVGQKFQYKRIPLDHRFKDSEQMKKVFLAYQAELKELYVNGKFEDIRPRTHPSGAKYVGSETCNDCHDEEYDIWMDGVGEDGGPHPEATMDLKVNPNDDRMWVERQFDPECLSCHVTGWNPQHYYPYISGYMDFEKDKHLHGSGCENCHGPGSNHVAAENGDGGFTEKQRAEFQTQMVLTLPEAKKDHCMTCHDLDNSPEFLKDGAFEKYWAKIKHGGDE